MSRREWRNLRVGLLWISPWLVGFLVFMVYPIIYTFFLSFTDYTGFGSPRWIGVENYRQLLGDALFWTSLGNTLRYTFLAIAIGVPFTLVLALAMNQRVPEAGLYRAALYLPSILPVFALAFIALWLLNPRYGLLNSLGAWVGLAPINWLGDSRWARLAIVLMAQFGAGQVALIYLAGMQAIPLTLYESATIDGAGPWRMFWQITLPLLTPAILYQCIIGLALGLQVFTQAYILTGGGPQNATLFYVMYLYQNAFRYSQIGYAAALAWVLFGISLLLALAVFRWAQRWVHYDLV